MIDVHSHILPNVDDGACNINESINMIKEAYNAGFNEIISTSHYMEECYTVSKNKRKELIAEIEKRLAAEKIDVKIYNGAEVYITSNLVNLIKEEKITTINDTKYLLMELPRNSEVIYLNEVISSLRNNGIIPIIAHPERYSYVQENPKILIDLLQRGVLFQVNFGSVGGLFGKSAQKTVIKLLKKDMIHFLGSDVHSENSIYKRIITDFKES